MPELIETYTKEIVDVRLDTALAKLIRNDLSLIKNNAHERSICFRLALYLQEEFPTFHVDCEYNRHYNWKTDSDLYENEQNLHKRLYEKELLKLKKKFTEQEINYEGISITVFPDIIVHRRNTNDNLLVIEAKKSSNKNADDHAYDKAKLKAYKKELGYIYTKFLVFQTEAKEGENLIKELPLEDESNE